MIQRGSFVRGAVILAFTGIVVKVIGAIMRIVLAALMGDEGIGLFQMAYPVYVTLLTISTAGIPVAISKLVAEKLALNNHRGAHQVFRLSMIVLTVSGLAITGLLIVGAEYFAINVAKDARAYLPILAISPAIFFVTIMSAMRGFFQGYQDMTPTALSQFFEQLVRVVTSIALVIMFLNVSLEYAAAGAAFGAVTGGIAGLLVVIIIYYRQKSDYSQKISSTPSSMEQAGAAVVLTRIIALSIPVTLGSIMVPLINLLDLSIVPMRLHEAGFNTERATALYGQLTGMAMSLAFFPSIVLIALAISLVPAISEAYALQNKRLLQNRIEISDRFTILFALPASTGLFLLSLPYTNQAVTMLLYNNAEAAYPVAILSWVVIFMSFYLTTTGILQGMGHPIIPVRNMAVGGVVKIVITWVLTGIPSIHVGGAAFGTVVGFMVVAFLNMYSVSRLTGYRLRIGELLIKPVFATLLMTLVAIISYKSVFALLITFTTFSYANAAGVIASMTGGGGVYFIVLLLSGWLREDDLRSMPRIGDKAADLLIKTKLLR